MQSKYGVIFGILSITMAIAAVFSSQQYNPNDWFLFEWLGTVPAPDNHQTGLYSAPPDLFEISEKNMIRWLFILSVPSALLAIFFALAGETKHENTLYTAVGSILGWTALSIINIWLGLATMITAFAAVLIIRSKRGKAA